MQASSRSNAPLIHVLIPAYHIRPHSTLLYSKQLQRGLEYVETVAQDA